uniref:NADH dehydrogenase subunit 4L n=1 Tax=Paraleius leontonychus TaxID=1807943 RepID=A0A330JET7_9ACAR|nr:NADH dehydrogenase subunit 4L [Paraleius leontonychus]
MLFFALMILFGFVIFLFYNVHYLVLLLSIELILLGTLFFLFVNWGGGESLVNVFLFFLLMACMGGFSVSLLVSLFRGLGRDFWFGRGFF